MRQPWTTTHLRACLPGAQCGLAMCATAPRCLCKGMVQQALICGTAQQAGARRIAHIARRTAYRPVPAFTYFIATQLCVCSKINLGLAAYGRSWTLASPSQTVVGSLAYIAGQAGQCTGKQASWRLGWLACTLTRRLQIGAGAMSHSLASPATHVSALVLGGASHCLASIPPCPLWSRAVGLHCMVRNQRQDRQECHGKKRATPRRLPAVACLCMSANHLHCLVCQPSQGGR